MIEGEKSCLELRQLFFPLLDESAKSFHMLFLFLLEVCIHPALAQFLLRVAGSFFDEAFIILHRILFTDHTLVENLQSALNSAHRFLFIFHNFYPKNFIRTGLTGSTGLYQFFCKLVLLQFNKFRIKLYSLELFIRRGELPPLTQPL